MTTNIVDIAEYKRRKERDAGQYVQVPAGTIILDIHYGLNEIMVVTNRGVFTSD